MSNLETNKQFLLDQNSIEEYPWNVYVVINKTTGEKIQILDSNGNSPKTQAMSARQQAAYQGVTDQLPSYMVTVVKEDEVNDLIRSKYEWLLSFDDGNTFSKFYADVRESPMPGLYFEIILTKTS